MANFQTHVTTSTVLGIGYAGVGAVHGLPIESCLVAGGLCGIGGMLPDIDSDNGRPLRETMSFAAAVAPMMLHDRFQHFGFNSDQIVLATGATYLFVRFALARLLARYTVHRGMFHSIPAMLIFTGLAFLLSNYGNLQLRYFKAGGVMLGVFSHLLLDEIYAVEWVRGRWRFKKSFGTALKLWGPSLWGNLSVYLKLAAVVLLILSEPMVMERYGQIAPIVVDQATIRQRLEYGLGTEADPALFADAAAVGQGDGAPPVTPAQRDDVRANAPQPDRTIYDTARRIWHSLRQ